ncbi:FAD-binding oxidoreductase [Bacteroidales bacterium AH-315-I05]|nr:FAD-binding oxidoreductase [Bacteroidales bacterium AH-315-I05]
MAITRRKFIQQSAVFSAGMLALGCSGLSALSKKQRALYREIEKSIEGKVAIDISTLDTYGMDYSRAFYRKPLVVVFPKNTEDIAKVLEIANQRKVSVKARGEGHSFYGQALNQDGILICTKTESEQIKLNESGLSLPAGITWLEVENFLNAKNLSFPLLPGFLELSVGGTLVHSGVSRGSINMAHQIDHIKSAEILTAEGQLLTCSSEENQDIFKNTFATLGSLGVVTRVKFEQPPPLKESCYFTIACSSWEDYVEKLGYFMQVFNDKIDYIIGRNLSEIEVGIDIDSRDEVRGSEFDHIRGKFKGSDFSFSGDFKKSMHRQYANAIEAYPIFLSMKKLWNHYLLDYDGFAKFIKYCFENKYKFSLKGKIKPDLTTFLINHPKKSLFPFSPAYHFSTNQMLVCMGVFYNIEEDDLAAQQEAREKMIELKDLCVELNGRPYLYGYHGLTEEDKMKIYGNDFEELKRLKKLHDPNGILNNTFI